VKGCQYRHIRMGEGCIEDTVRGKVKIAQALEPKSRLLVFHAMNDLAKRVKADEQDGGELYSIALIDEYITRVCQEGWEVCDLENLRFAGWSMLRRFVDYGEPDAQTNGKVDAEATPLLLSKVAEVTVPKQLSESDQVTPQKLLRQMLGRQ